MDQKRFCQSTLCLQDRKSLTLSGVESVKDVTNSLINLVCCSEKMSVCGENLEVVKLDVEGGTIIVTGKISAIKYAGKKEPFLKRVFK